MNARSRSAIEKIIMHASRAIEYSSNDAEWLDDNQCLEAIAFNLAQIGELVRFVESEIQIEHNQVNWPGMRGLRNRIIHDYDDIKPLVIKAIVQNDLPRLVQDLKRILMAN